MSGRSKKKRAKRKAKKEEKQASFAMAEDNWGNYSQWKYDAESSRDTSIQGLNQKYGTENQKLRDILVAEEDRKFGATMTDLNAGATGQQLQQHQQKYGDKNVSMDDYYLGQYGEFRPDETSTASEDAAAAGAGGRAPGQPMDDDEGKTYYGW